MYTWMITCNVCGDMVAVGSLTALPTWTNQDVWSNSEHNAGCDTTLVDHSRFAITNTEDPSGFWISYVINWA